VSERRLDMMIDLECAGGAPDGAIVSIGWCIFALDGLPNATGDTLGPVSDAAYGRIAVNVQSCLDIGMEIDERTLREFWFKQPEAVRRLWGESNAITIQQALRQVNDIYCGHCTGGRQDGYVWAYPSTYDLSILDRAYELSGTERKFGRKDYLCSRSVMKGIGYRRTDEKIPEKWREKHLPEKDAVRQVIQLQLALNPDWRQVSTNVVMRLPHTITHDQVEFRPLRNGSGSAHTDFANAVEAEARRLFGKE
jgi:hypothetical protein